MNMLQKFTFLLFFITVSYTVIYSQANPLFSNDEVIDTILINDTIIVDNTSIVTENNETSSFSLFSDLIRKNASLQNDIRNNFADLANDFSSTSSIKVLFLLFFMAFAYGVFHSLGPGHGKIFIFSYILTEKPKIIKAISISYMIATIHAVSGLAVALGIIFILEQFSSFAYTSSSSSDIISQISFGIMMLIGLYMIYKAISNKEHSHKHSSSKKQLIPFILTAGLVPCPGTIIIVTFLASMNMLYLGVLSVIFIILGMGITISAIGILSIFSKKLVLKITSSDSEKTAKVYKIISLFGAIFLTLFGLIFFIGSF